MLFDITQLALERVIEGAGKRHEALAANLANANSPGTSASPSATATRAVT